jgi:hypothetical protein
MEETARATREHQPTSRAEGVGFTAAAGATATRRRGLGPAYFPIVPYLNERYASADAR